MSERPPLGLFYGSSTCYTEMAAERIRDALQANYTVNLHNIADDDLSACSNYALIIFGIPTWDYGELQEDWDRHWDELDDISFNGKVVAIYGLGDQLGYPDWFQDAMGYLYHKIVAQGAKVIGLWPAAGYQYNSSQALTNDQQFFVGLALDDENEFDKSESRIQQWCAQLVGEFVEVYK